MRLTAFSDYTLRTLIYLGLRPEKLVTIADIASAYDISVNHLMKVVHRLALTGDIVTLRGQHGGLRLARAPETINLGEVIRRTEPDFEMVTCFGETRRCTIQDCCVLQHVIGTALQAFLDVLDRYTLADLMAPRQALAALLGIPPEDDPPIV